MVKLKVLCAEDDMLTRIEMKEKLETKGWEVIEAEDGVEALEKYQQCNPDAVILDVDMPRRTGLEVLQLIRISDLQTPVLIYSSLTREEDVKAGFTNGAKVYIIKSYSVDILVEQLDHLVWKTDMEMITLTDGVTYNFASGELMIGERCEKLSALENKVFSVLCKNENKLSRRELLLQAGWKNTNAHWELQLNKVIRKLRQLLERTDGLEIVMDKGNGYWLKEKTKQNQ